MMFWIHFEDIWLLPSNDISTKPNSLIIHSLGEVNIAEYFEIANRESVSDDRVAIETDFKFAELYFFKSSNTA